ncbi:hypothetical protein [Palleronia marisminoris]|uniref:hypothetical protein n=1 Tax=Palleronia marisminoris TaxID=315423 RepID=UPI00158769DF|nr:hypothetical protein [Palleronia marisminoris]
MGKHGLARAPATLPQLARDGLRQQFQPVLIERLTGPQDGCKGLPFGGYILASLRT